MATSDGFGSATEIPRYTVPEAARYLQMAETTLKSWIAGRSYLTKKNGATWWENLIHRPDPKDPRLSFSNLAEAFVLHALRKQYRVKMREVRIALDYARRELGVERILLSRDLRVIKGSLFLQRINDLVNVGMGGQGAMPEVLGAYLERIDWDEEDLPLRMFPLTRTDDPSSPRLLAINPKIALGRPIVERKAIKTSVLAERFKAGESIFELADDYDLEAIEVEEAIRYEALPLAA